jgi:PIN domain nuclease of toxin-antitoxin system
MTPSPEAVIDTSALIALVHEEPGWEHTRTFMAAPIISAVNLAEAILVLRRHGMPLEQVRDMLGGLFSAPVSFDHDLAYLAAAIHEQTRSAGLSFGDCACLALARSRGVPAITAEKSWAALDVGVRVILIR